MGRGSKRQRTKRSRSEFKELKLKQSSEKAVLDSNTVSSEKEISQKMSGESTANFTPEIAITEASQNPEKFSAFGITIDDPAQKKSSVPILEISSCDQTPSSSAVCSEAPSKANIDSQAESTKEIGLEKITNNDVKFYSVREVGDMLKKCQNTYEQKLLEKEKDKIVISEQYVTLKLEKEEICQDTKRIAECYQNDAMRFDNECDKLYADIKALEDRLEKLKKEKQQQAENFKIENENLKSKLMNKEKENSNLRAKIKHLESEKSGLLNQQKTSKDENENLKMKVKEQEAYRLQVFAKLQLLHQTVSPKNTVVNDNGCGDEFYDRAANIPQPEHFNNFFDEIQKILEEEMKQKTQSAILIQNLKEEKEQLRAKDEDLEMKNQLWENRYLLLENQKMTILIEKEEEEMRNVILQNKVKLLTKESNSKCEKIQEIQDSLKTLTSFNEKSRKSIFPFNRNVKCHRLSTLISPIENTLSELSQGSDNHQYDSSNEVDFHKGDGKFLEKKNAKKKKGNKNVGCFRKFNIKENKKQNESAKNQMEGCREKAE